MRLVDANIMVNAFTNNTENEKCRRLLKEFFVTNTLCLVEAQHIIANITSDRSYAADCIRAILRSNATIVPLDEPLLFEALKQIGRYGLNIFDLIHYTTAKLHECAEIVSYDADFDMLDIERIEP